MVKQHYCVVTDVMSNHLYISQSSHFEDAQPDLSPKEQKATSKPAAAAQRFKLRVALRSAPSTQHSTDDGDVQGEKRTTTSREAKRAGKPSWAKEKKHVKFEDEETAVSQPPPSEEPGSDSAEDVTDSFLAKREQNIKANKAMVNQKQRPQHTVQQYL